LLSIEGCRFVRIGFAEFKKNFDEIPLHERVGGEVFINAGAQVAGAHGGVAL